jgi:soluble lytic murein transglycosylase-like protein
VRRPRRRTGRTARALAAGLLAAGTLAGCGLTSVGSSERIPSDTVPAELIPLFRAAAAAYPTLTPAQLAAQARVESKFDPLAVSRTGATGLMQFMPDTWRHFGVDGDHDGRADPLDPADAILAAARYDAHLASLLTRVPGDRLTLVLAAYNAGPAAVRAAHGVPKIYETRDYVRRVRSWTVRFQPQFDAARPP